jgi:hypothetical protein
MPLPARRREHTLKIEGTHILFKPNFKGEEEQYNREGDRYFNVAISSEDVDNLRAEGWNVKEWKGKEEDDETLYFIKVKVSFKFKPPRLVLITSRGRVPLDEETCEILDWQEYEFVDVILSASHYKINGRSGISAYLKTGMFVVMEDELEKKYAHLPEVGMDPILAIEPPSDVMDGEVIAEWEEEEEFIEQVKQAESRKAITA